MLKLVNFNQDMDRPRNSRSRRDGYVRVGGGLQLEGLRGEVEEIVEIYSVDRGHESLGRKSCV